MRIRIRIRIRIRNPAKITKKVKGSVADPDPGSGAFLTLDPGSGIQNRFFLDPGSWIFSISTIILFTFLWNLWLQKRYDNKFFFSPLSFVAVFGSGIRDGWKSGSGIQDKNPGSAILVKGQQNA
jgi:hypothetical protein